jgi:hypothetical protein
MANNPNQGGQQSQNPNQKPGQQGQNLHQADIALGDRQSVAAIVSGDLGREPQMAGDELMRCVAIAVLAPALG